MPTDILDMWTIAPTIWTANLSITNLQLLYQLSLSSFEGCSKKSPLKCELSCVGLYFVWHLCIRLNVVQGRTVTNTWLARAAIDFEAKPKAVSDAVIYLFNKLVRITSLTFQFCRQEKKNYQDFFFLEICKLLQLKTKPRAWTQNCIWMSSEMESRGKTDFTVNPPSRMFTFCKHYLKVFEYSSSREPYSLSRSAILDSKLVSHSPRNHSVRTNVFLWARRRPLRSASERGWWIISELMNRQPDFGSDKVQKRRTTLHSQKIFKVIQNRT